MGSTRYLIQALVHGEKNDKQNYKKKITADRLERGIDTIDACENVDKIDGDDGPRSMCFIILFYWGLFEMVILSLVLLKTGRKNYGQQVIHKLCENDCSNYITNGLIIRLLLALYMTLGAFRVSFVRIHAAMHQLSISILC